MSDSQGEAGLPFRSREDSPSLSVVLLAYGEEPYLDKAVRAVLSSENGHGQSLDLQVVLVDNGASPDAVARVSGLPGVRVLTPRENTGFAGGCNLGAAGVKSEYLALVNSDALVSENALAKLVEVAAESGVGIATSSLRLADAPDTMNSAGNPLHLTGLVWAGSHGQAATQHQNRRSVACASGAAMVLRRSLWEDLGGFAPEYFAYHEDTELSLRCWQRGLSVVYVPDAVVLHHYEFSRTPTKLYLVERNRLVLVATAYSGRLLLLLSPLLIAFEIAVAFAAIAGGWWSQKWAGWRWVAGNLGWIRSRRAQLQSERTISDRELAGLFSSRLDAANIDVPRMMSVLNPVVAGYWAVVRRLL
ncbi:MAG: glycosyltransferase family 2 protein [Geodermatophilaceae bacterium]